MGKLKGWQRILLLIIALALIPAGIGGSIFMSLKYVKSNGLRERLKETIAFNITQNQKIKALVEKLKGQEDPQPRPRLSVVKKAHDQAQNEVLRIADELCLEAEQSLSDTFLPNKGTIRQDLAQTRSATKQLRQSVAELNVWLENAQILETTLVPFITLIHREDITLLVVEASLSLHRGRKLPEDLQELVRQQSTTGTKLVADAEAAAVQIDARVASLSKELGPTKDPHIDKMLKELSASAEELRQTAGRIKVRMEDIQNRVRGPRRAA